MLSPISEGDHQSSGETNNNNNILTKPATTAMSSTINRRARRQDEAKSHPLILPRHADSPPPSSSPRHAAAAAATSSKLHHYRYENIPTSTKVGLLGTVMVVWLWWLSAMRTYDDHQHDASSPLLFSSRSMFSSMHYIKPEIVYPRLVVLHDKMMKGGDDEYSSSSSSSSTGRSNNNNNNNHKETSAEQENEDRLKLPRRGRYVSHMGDKHMFKKIKSSKDYRALDEYDGEDESDCQLQFDWQKTSYPACNNMHEFDLTNPSTESGKKKYKMLTNGYYRDVWSMYDDIMKEVVFKPMRIRHTFSFRNMDRMRRDALAMDRLTKEKYILDIYGYCSTSGLFEFADGGDVERVIWPDDSHSHRSTAELSKMQKLHIAMQAAMALASVHNVDAEGKATIAHTDIAPGQFMKVGNIYKLQDFNRARFIRYSETNHTACPFFVSNNAGKNRSPEEYAYGPEDEKVDVYSFGNILYMLLQSDWPFDDVDDDEAAELVQKGTRPNIYADVWNSTDPVDQVLKKAMIMCHQQDPKTRATARSVETLLKDAMKKLDPGRLEEWGDV